MYKLYLCGYKKNLEAIIMKKTGIFYGPVGGSTEKVANLILNELGTDNAELVLVKNAGVEDLKNYDKIIFGIATIGKETWDAEHPNTDWDVFFPKMQKFDFSGKTVAMFGLGDSVSYAAYFCDAMGKLGKKLSELNANIVGQVSTDDYTYEESEAVIDGKFIGLPVDEDFEDHLTEERIGTWVNSIKSDIL